MTILTLVHAWGCQCQIPDAGEIPYFAPLGEGEEGTMGVSYFAGSSFGYLSPRENHAFENAAECWTFIVSHCLDERCMHGLAVDAKSAPRLERLSTPIAAGGIVDLGRLTRQRDYVRKHSVFQILRNGR